MDSAHSLPRLYAAASLLLLACGCADLDTPLGPLVRPQSRPAISGIAPTAVKQGAEATLVVTGANFLPELTAFVGTAERDTFEFARSQLGRVEFVDTTRVRLHLPSNLPRGLLDVTIINPDDGLARAPRALTVEPIYTKDGLDG